MPISLEEIKAPIKSELDFFAQHFKESMKTDVALLDTITQYIIRSKGKQVRPMFVLLSAKMNGQINDATYVAASLMELLHTASLVHDDVVDDAYERRGFMSINALWKNKIAVLVGDYLLSQGLLVALKNDRADILKITSQAVKEMSEGELLQIEKARRLDIKEEIYFDIIRKKTASLIAAACSAGAASVTNDSQTIEHMRQLGETIGICFQIKDDLFDYGDLDVGKPLGIDIKEQKMTLPLIYALNNATKDDRSRIINIVKNNNNQSDKVKEVIQFVKNSGGIEYSVDWMNKYYRKSLEMLETYPKSDAREALSKLLEFTLTRKK
jgi:octaprenyl-diphosphate synthase